MLSRAQLQQHLAGPIALIALAAAAVPAAAADITLTEAKIEAGFLVVAGTTATPNTRIRLDGQSESAFNAVSARGGAFSFNIVYHPGDCIVTLQTVIPPFAALGAPTNGLVANCGRDALSPRGAWNELKPYVLNDLVTHLGSTWRARRNNIGNEPVEGGNWELFAAAGQLAGEVSEAGGAQDDNLRAPPDGPAGGDLTGEYPNPLIRNQAVETENIATGAITTARIAVAAVTSAKIAGLAVHTGHIADGAVTNLQIALGAVNGATVLDSSLTADDLGSSSVGSSEIQSDAVGATEIANDAIDSGEIDDDSLFSVDLGAGSVGSSELIDASVTGTDIASGTITAADIASSTITGTDVANNSLTLSDISGADIDGVISLGAGEVANGRCEDFSIGVGGSSVGDGVVISLQGSLPAGILIYGVRVASAGTAIMKLCNFSGGAMAAINNLQIKAITFN